MLFLFSTAFPYASLAIIALVYLFDMYLNGHYGCPKVNTQAIPLQATFNFFINWLLGLTSSPGFEETIMGFTRTLGLCFTPTCMAMKGNSMPIQLIVCDKHHFNLYSMTCIYGSLLSIRNEDALFVYSSTHHSNWIHMEYTNRQV